MLIIRKEQIEALEQDVRLRFEDELRRWFRQEYPKQMQALGEGPMRAFVRLAVERALGHGLDGYQVCSHYLMIASSLGAFFDGDPQYPWARETLEEQGLDAERKIGRLRLLTARHVGVITGPGGSYLHAALRQMQALATNPNGSLWIPDC